VATPSTGSNGPATVPVAFRKHTLYVEGSTRYR
jgi:hypothetical protein